MAKIRNCGDMREFMANVILGIRDKKFDTGESSQIMKLAAQINESLYAEAKVMKMRFDILGERPGEVGSLSIGAPEENPTNSA